MVQKESNYNPLTFWKNSGSQVLTKSSLNQSYLSILTSVELVSQVKLSVSFCLFVCLSVCMFHPLLRMKELLFLKLWICTFEALMRWSQRWKFTSVTYPRASGVIFANFYGLVLRSSFSSEQFNIFSWNFVELFLVLYWWSPHTQKVTAWHSLLGFILGYFWACWDAPSNIFWEQFNIFAWNFIQMLLVYSDNCYTIFFLSCPSGAHSGVCSSIPSEPFDIFWWNFA